MPRKSKGVRKWLRKRKGRPSTWVILDGPVEISTGCIESDVAGADRELEKYLAKRHRPEFHDGDPRTVLTADIMIYYVSERASDTASPELIAMHMNLLNVFFGAKMVSEITPKACRDYAKLRVSGSIGRAVKPATARRELETLQAALNFAHKEQKLLFPFRLELPNKSAARLRFLTRGEAARLIAGALGFVPTWCDIETRQLCGWRRLHRPQYHVARFILIGLYTGTRHDAILKLGWQRNKTGGWFDIADGMLYRKGDGQAETNKRRPPARIPGVLARHLRRWRRLTVSGPVEYHGQLIKKMRTGFENARDRSFLDRDVLPHTLRHTCATWLLTEGETPWEVAGFLGTTEQIIRSTYGHHTTESREVANERFRGRKLGES